MTPTLGRDDEPVDLALLTPTLEPGLTDRDLLGESPQIDLIA